MKYHFNGAIIVFGNAIHNYPAGITYFCSLSGRLHEMQMI